MLCIILWSITFHLSWASIQDVSVPLIHSHANWLWFWLGLYFVDQKASTSGVSTFSLCLLEAQYFGIWNVLLLFNQKDVWKQSKNDNKHELSTMFHFPITSFLFIFTINLMMKLLTFVVFIFKLSALTSLFYVIIDISGNRSQNYQRVLLQRIRKENRIFFYILAYYHPFPWTT